MNKRKNSFVSSLLQNKFIIFLSGVVGFLRFPFLLEPIQNNRETFYYLAADKMATAPLKLNFWEQPIVWFLRLSFLFLGDSFWSIKFAFSLLIILELILFWSLAVKTHLENKLKIIFIFLGIISSFSFFVTNSLNYFSFYLIPFIILATFLVYKIRFVKDFSKSILIIGLIILFFVFFYFSEKPKVSFSYYANFLTYVSQSAGTNTRAQENYLASFGKDVSASYALGGLLAQRSSNKDSLFVLGDYFSIYAISHRPASTNLITNFRTGTEKVLVNDLADEKPLFIVIQNKSENFPLIDTLIKNRYNRLEQSYDVTIFQLKAS